MIHNPHNHHESSSSSSSSSLIVIIITNHHHRHQSVDQWINISITAAIHQSQLATVKQMSTPYRPHPHLEILGTAFCCDGAKQSDAELRVATVHVGKFRWKLRHIHSSLILQIQVHIFQKCAVVCTKPQLNSGLDDRLNDSITECN